MNGVKVAILVTDFSISALIVNFCVISGINAFSDSALVVQLFINNCTQLRNYLSKSVFK